MTTPPKNDWLDDLLHEEPAYIDDSGFTARVIGQLSSLTRPNWARCFILGFASFCGLIAGYFSLPSSQEIFRRLHFSSFSTNFSQTFLLEVVTAVAALFITSCLFCVSREK